MTALFIAAFATFFVVIDPPGVTPVFAGLTEGATPAHRRLMAFKSVAIAAGVLVGFAFGGAWLLRQLQITLDAFRIAGGVMLFVLALEMLFEKRQERRQGRLDAHDHEPHPPNDDISVFPMAIPMIAGPGAIASILLYMNEHAGLAERAVVFAAIGANHFACLVLFLAAGPVMRVMGRTLAAMVSRILGLILAALSAQFIIDGVRGAFGLG